MSQLVRIPTLGKDRTPLSKAQKEFNRLTKKIGELEEELEQFRATATQIQQRVYAEYEPLLRSFNTLRASLVRLFDRAYDRPDMTNAERKKLADRIVNLAYELIRNHGMDELRAIYDKYDSEGYKATHAEADQHHSEIVNERGKAMDDDSFGERIDGNAQDAVQDNQAEDQPHWEEAQERRSQQANAAKGQKREAKRLIDDRKSTKAVRTLYIDLVKAFHPDLERDEDEKSRKTEIMKQVTKAYEKNDLLSLLRLQLAFNRIDQQQLETLADDQLRYYNNLLRQQADELAHELHDVQSQLATFLNKPLRTVGSALSLEYSFNNDIRTLKSGIKAMQKDIRALADPAVLKSYLKAYKIQKADEFDG